MNSCNKKCNFNSCSCLAIAAALLIGAAVGALFYFGFLPGIVPDVAQIAIRLGILTIAYILLAQLFSSLYLPNPVRDCLCCGIAPRLVGAFGTVILGIAILSVALTPGNLIFAALVGLGAAFLALLIIALISFINCVLCRMCLRD
jgi:hypothetical protein